MKTRLLSIIFSIALVFLVYPSAFIYPQDTLPDSNDTRLLAYIIGQVQENILQGQPLYYGKFFAPDQNTLTYSDLFLTSSVLTLPFRFLTSSPIAIFNLAFILNFSLTVLTSFYFFKYVLKNTLTSLICTLLFSLSGFHLHYYAHLQVFSLWLFFSALINILKFFKEKNNKYLFLFLIFTTLQLAESIFTTYLLFFSVIFILLDKYLHGDINKKLFLKANLNSKVIIKIAVFPVIWLLLLYPYAKLHFSFPEATRSIRDASHFSLGLDEFFTRYHSWTAITLLLFTFLKKNKILNLSSWYSKGLLFFSFLMSLGPTLKLFGQNLRIFGLPIPLPYSLFYYLFPGFTGFRTPSRFIILTLLASCIIIGFYLKDFLKSLKPKTRIILTLFIFTLLCLEAKLPLTGYPVNINLPTVYRKLQQLPEESIILELPIKLWNMPDHEIESIRSLYTLEHHHRRFGGYSGFATLNWIKLVEQINAYGLNSEITQSLKNLGVTHIIQDNSLTPL